MGVALIVVAALLVGTAVLGAVRAVAQDDGAFEGVTTFVIANAGSIYHSFAIVGDGVEAALEAPLAPGDTAELTVDLPAGTYQIVYPVANHETLGMTRELTVV